jgi:hypothetical protein
MKPTKAIALGLGFAALSSLSFSAEDPDRLWTDKQGRQLKALFVGLDGDKISLQNPSGQVYSFPLTNLSEADQALAKTMKPAAAYITNNATVAQAAAKIDDLVMKGLRRGAAVIEINNSKATDAADKRIVPTANPLMTDEQFVRRAYLDIAGLMPTYDQTKGFLDSTSKSKRAELITTLLDSPGYASNLYNYFAEMLRVKDSIVDGTGLKATPYIKWLRTQAETNRPWNEMVADMITADGKLWKDTSGDDSKTGATGYFLRDTGMPLDNLANTLAVFLGTDVSCAQCHNHPFAEWTQHQFYEMASYFGATTTDLRTAERRARTKKGAQMAMMNMRGDGGVAEEALALMEKGGADLTRERQDFQQFLRANRAVVSDMTENTLKLPHDYKYKDAKPYDAVKPKLITWSPSDRSSPAYKAGAGKKNNEEKLRESFSAWLTHPENPRFAMSIANRMWKRAFGVAVQEPVTNIDDPKNSNNPELLIHLAAEMKRLKFDMKKFMEVVYNTQTYQRQATTDAVPMGEPYYFQGPLLRRMSAEQAWDSYMALVLGENADSYKRPLEDLYSRSIDMDLTNPKLDAKTMVLKYAAYKGMGEKMKGMMEKGGLDDADMMMDGKGAMAEGDTKMGNKTLTFGGMTLRRAAEIEQPARAGHFLTEFGQSQRTLIDGGMKNGSVPQVLMMMNGAAQEMLTSTQSLVLRRTGTLATQPEKIESVFLSVLSRRPSAEEQKMADGVIGANATAENYADLVWALINTREFMFVQ